MRNLSIINESEDIVTKEYADQKLPGRPITKYDYDHLSPAEKDADIVYFIIDDDQDALEFDEVPTAGSDNPVKSKGIKAALDAKQNTLTFDQTPTAGSQNPVTSGGVKSAIDNLVVKLTLTKTFTSGYVDIPFSDYSAYGADYNSILFAPPQFIGSAQYDMSTRWFGAPNNAWRVYARAGTAPASGELTFRAILIP